MKRIIQRYNPEKDDSPYVELFELDDSKIKHDTMLLEVLLMLRQQDSSLAFRSSCQEGVCGSDGMNVNGKNHLSCITPVADLKQPITIKPLPGLPIIKDLIIDMSLFYQQYNSVKPYLQTERLNSEHEHLQTPEQRAELDGGYECILCAC